MGRNPNFFLLAFQECMEGTNELRLSPFYFLTLQDLGNGKKAVRGQAVLLCIYVHKEYDFNIGFTISSLSSAFFISLNDSQGRIEVGI